MTQEAAFVKAWGREPTALEVERLRRLREAFSIDENDALLTIAMVLEFYDGLFRLYPNKCGEAARDALANWIASSEGVAALRGARGTPSSKVPPPARPGPASDAVERRRELYWVALGGIAMASSALSAALGMRVVLALSGDYPCWVPRSAVSSLAINLIGAPMGWVVLWALLIPAVCATVWGWKRGRDARRSPRHRAAGWAAVAGIGSVLVGWCYLLWQLAEARQ